MGKSLEQVVKGIRDDVHDVALKILSSAISKDVVMKEVTLLKSCQNSNIVQVSSSRKFLRLPATLFLQTQNCFLG